MAQLGLTLHPDLFCSDSWRYLCCKIDISLVDVFVCCLIKMKQTCYFQDVRQFLINAEIIAVS